MMEYMDGGSLQELVDLGGVASEQLLASIAFQAFSGLNFLHVNNRLHRDIKPANLLINHKGFVKISDLGIAKELQGTEGSQGPVPLLCEHGDLKDLEHSFDYGEQNVGGMRKTHTFVGSCAHIL
jgi:serine/threonine protein kinase